MFCNCCRGFFGVGVGRFPQNLPFLSGCCGDGCRRGDECGCCR